MPYIDVTGVSLFYEEHGSGDPLVLLHGGIGSGADFAPVLPALAEGRRTIAVDLQGHGRTADVDRPLRPATMAADVAGLIEHLGLGRADVLGYSLGGVVALQTAIRHPERVRRLILVSVAGRRDGSFPEVVAAFDQFSPDAAPMIAQSPPGQFYAQHAPRPEDWRTLIAKTADLLHEDYDWTEGIAALAMPVLLVYADADSVRPDHVAELYRLLGGGLRDASWDGSAQPTNRLAVLPGQTHYDMLTSPLLAPAVAAFLDADL